MTQQSAFESMSIQDWDRVANPWRVVEGAADFENARQSALSRIIDTMLELQLVYRHESVGYQPFSITGNVPMPGGGKAVDQCMLAAERYHPHSQWHKACAWLLRQLPPRQAAAMLLQAARVRPEKAGTSAWTVTAAQLVERQGDLLRALGMSEWAPSGFDSVESLQKCARRARNTLREWLKDEQVQQVA